MNIPNQSLPDSSTEAQDPHNNGTDHSRTTLKDAATDSAFSTRGNPTYAGTAHRSIPAVTSWIPSERDKTPYTQERLKT